MFKDSASSRQINAFQKCWDLGYRGLLPVVPPDGGIPNAGKRPGVRLPGGTWVGKASREFTASPDTIDLWASWGASVGLSCHGTGLCGIDIDTLSPKWAQHVLDLAHEMLGPAPRRIGREPKVLLPYRCPVDLRYAQIRFRDDHERPQLLPERGLKLGLVECLAGETKWFVAHGMHPQTRQPYRWPDGMPGFSGLTEITAAARDAFLEQLRLELPDAHRREKGPEGPAPVPSKLKGDLDMVAEAVRATPNDPDMVTYDMWRDMAAALRGAVGFSDGLELFVEWTEKSNFDKPREQPHRVFSSFDPPMRLGADYIFHQAEKAGWTGWARAWDHLADTEVPPEEEPYESIFGKNASGDEETGSAERFKFVSIDDVAERALDHEPRPLIKGLLEEQTMSVVYGDSNVGKTFVVMDMAYHVATGRAYSGMPVTQGGVAYVTTEGGRGVDDRLLALKTFYKDGPGVPFYLLSTDIDLHAPNGDTGPLIAAVKGLGVPISLIVVDVLAQAMGQGEENAGRDMGAMVKNGNRIIRSTGSHLMWIHHTGKDAARGARGHSSLRAGTDTELEVIEGEITATKQRNLNRSWTTAFRLVPFTAGARRKGMQMIDTCIVELLPKGSRDAGITAPLQEVASALAELGARSEDRAVLASDVGAWLEDAGRKLKPQTVRMRLNRLVDMGGCLLVKRGPYSRYHLKPSVFD